MEEEYKPINVRKFVVKPFVLKRLHLEIKQTGKKPGQIFEEAYERQCLNNGVGGKCGCLIADITKVLNNYKDEVK